jgi:hypothetical protein
MLGVTVEAIRGRMHRGKYVKEKADDGRVYVRLAPEQLAAVREHSDEYSGVRLGDNPSPAPDQTRLVEELRDQNAFLRGELETRAEEISRRDAIIMQLSQSLRTLEALQPASKEEGNEDYSQEVGGTAQGEQGKTRSAQPRRWLVRFFYGR